MDSSSSIKQFPIREDWANQVPIEILESFQQDEPPIIFFGSGMAKEAIPPLPTSGDLAIDLREKLDINDNGENLPELFQFLLNDFAGSKKRITEWLSEKLFITNSSSGGAYQLLLQLPTKLYITTNFDLLLDDASKELGYTLRDIDEPSNIPTILKEIQSSEKTKVVGRIHGSFNKRENIIVTTDDFITWDQKAGNHWKEYFKEFVKDKRVIFIGYSLRDFTTWQSFISVFFNYPGHMYPHALISPNDSRHYKPFWNKYSIKYIPLTAYQFLITVHDFLGNLCDEKEEICIAAAAAHLKIRYSETQQYLLNVMADNHYSSITKSMTKILMDESHAEK